MTDLITVTNIPLIEETGRLMVSGRDLHNALTIRTEYMHWFNRMVKEFDFIDGVDFSSNLTKTPNSNGGRPSTNHLITLDMAKEICMITRNGQGKAVRKYFIQCEKDWNTPERVLSRALLIANSLLKQITEKPTLESATSDQIIYELHKRLA